MFTSLTALTYHEIAVMTITAPLVVVGSVNADIYVEVDKLPKEGETIVAKSGHTFAGGLCCSSLVSNLLRRPGIDSDSSKN